MTKQRVIICEDFEKELLSEINNIPANQLFVLTDEYTYRYCYPFLTAEKLKEAHVICVKQGDESKNVQTLSDVWMFLSTHGATRHSLLINLGGGMVCDLGGFAASTFKRGIAYINVPTTLLSIIDAAVGGKTGINFNGLKNEIGVINPAQSVLVNINFLKTLDEKNMLSGYAEILKHALICNNVHWEEVVSFNLKEPDFGKLKHIIAYSVAIKERIVTEDPNERGIRKALNFGHTIGHAFESFSYQDKRPLLHGFAVAYGIVCELYLSYRKLNFPKEIMMQTINFVKNNYDSFYISCKNYDALYELMTHDKKNNSEKVNFTLLNNIGKIEIDQIVEKEDIFDALDFYCECAGF